MRTKSANASHTRHTHPFDEFVHQKIVVAILLSVRDVTEFEVEPESLCQGLQEVEAEARVVAGASLDDERVGLQPHNTNSKTLILKDTPFGPI